MQDLFLAEILSQPQIIRGILEPHAEDSTLLQPLVEMARQQHDLILLTGMGSSYFALHPACIYLNDHGLPAVLLETSELLHYHQGLISDRVLVLVVSQSGETVEATKLLDQIRGKATLLSVTSNLDSTVAGYSDLPLLLPIGQEQGPASKSYTASLALLLLSASALASVQDEQLWRQLHAGLISMEHALDGWQERIGHVADRIGHTDRLTLLARGPSLASATAGSLILKEVAKIQAEAMSCGQFRHGPLEIAGPGFVAILFASGGRTRELNLGLADDIARFGGTVVLVGGDEIQHREGIIQLPLPFPGELAAPLAEIIPVQLLAWRMALDRGLEPGVFAHAGKVTLDE